MNNHYVRSSVREFVHWCTRVRTLAYENSYEIVRKVSYEKMYENRIFVILLRNPDLRELRKSYENVIPSV
jgi:hypothetical protein